MQRVGSILLSLLAVIVVAGAVYVVIDDGGSGGAPIAGASTAQSPPSSAATTPTAPRSAPATTAAASDTTASTGTSGPPSSARRPVVAFLGDDWTNGAGATSPEARFTTVLSRTADITEKNFGADGTGYAKRTADAGDYASRVADVIAAKPDVVVVSGGRNDVYLDLATVDTDARNMFDALAAGLPDARIIAVAPFWGDSAPPAQLADVANSVRQAVQRVGGTYLELTDPILDHPDYMADAADPNDDGYAAVAAALQPKLERALSD